MQRLAMSTAIASPCLPCTINRRMRQPVVANAAPPNGCTCKSGRRMSPQKLPQMAALQQAEAPPAEASLFQRLGGQPAVRAAVDLFYDKMLADPRVNYFFEGVDMKGQRAHQAAFLSYAMGGTDRYDGNANMTTAHQKLVKENGMNMQHFDVVIEHLGAALADLGVSQELIGEAAGTVETLRPAFQVAIDRETQPQQQ